jgi:DNA polymerase-3 subunit epsilon
LPQPNPEADPTGPLSGHVILFTGDLLAMGREEAQRKAADQGARNANALTNKTTILVMGSTGASIPKRNKAWGQASKGHPIRVISDSEFTAMLSA